MGPVTYQGEQLATTFVAQIMDQEWLVRQERRSEDYLLFFEKDGNILWTSNPLYGDSNINVAESRLHDHDEYFRLHEVPLYETGSDLPRLWFGVSETHLVHMLKSYQQWVYLFAALGGMTVLLVGVLMLRNFRRPLDQLMLTTEQMINGQLPVMSRSESNTEMDRLVNRFADVLDALRNEQEEVRRAHKQLQETAITDSLTGLYNRRYLQEVAPSLLAQVERDGRHLVAVLLDLDHFKKINDCHGHLGGDAVLVHFARLLKHNSRVNDNLFRIGGEEFLILNVAEDTEESVMLANKIRELVSGAPAPYQGSEIPITVSIGISCYVGGSGGGSLSNLMRGADIALYEAKDGGRNKVVLHSSCHPPATSVRPQGGVAVVNGNLSVR
jgi:diguanylate cyclase (GGDEF)-like protein